MTGLELRRRLIARVYDPFMKRYESYIAGRRRNLLADVEGHVLELGPGTGTNFAYFPEGIRWTGYEPNRHMHAKLEVRARERGIEPAIHARSADGIDLPAESVDAVVATLVLCSVSDPAAVLRGVRRVLRPGGRFLFLEHVAAPEGSAAHRWQRRLRPLWRFCTDGCRLDRDAGTYVRAAGFDDIRMERFDAPPKVAPSFVAPHVVGSATA